MRVALLTISDSASAGEASDLSGPLLHKLVAEGGRTVVRAEIVPDDREVIAGWLCRATDEQKVDLVLTSGGTGLAPRDVTPEATRAVLDVEVPGIAEAIRSAGLRKTPRAMLSRGVAGVRKQTLIINLSGSPRAVKEQWAVIEPVIEHALWTVQGRGWHPQADAERRQAKPSTPPAPRQEPQRQAPKRSFSSGSDTLVGTPLADVIGEYPEELLGDRKRER